MLKDKLKDVYEAVSIFSKNKVIPAFFNAKNILRKQKKTLIAVGAGILVIASLVFMLNATVTQTHQKTEQSETQSQVDLNDEFQAVNLKLSSIQKKLNHNDHINLDEVRSSMKVLSTDMKLLSQHSHEILAREIKGSTDKLTQSIESIHKKLVLLENKEKKIEYIAVKALPFEIIAINNIQGQNIVAVSYNHTIFPINTGDYLANWKLISSDFAEQKAAFVNKQGQHVMVDLNRIHQTEHV